MLIELYLRSLNYFYINSIDASRLSSTKSGPTANAASQINAESDKPAGS